ncbi:MAG: hypothetical protein A3C79_03445 [Candidatus Taylorbacteria bacterium RIFCSPHIGHO2_02_FULL_45_28]|nr:MAG: hypothetical protein A3C79_03445 [Candidatus Taylorbacteria bacterium RIFCSPHIGHO2_02_FULL_45_28]
MTGKLIRIVRCDNGVMYLFWLGEKNYGRTYTGEGYRNYINWKDLKIEDQVDGLLWKNKDRKLLDGDSPVHISQ